MNYRLIFTLVGITAISNATYSCEEKKAQLVDTESQGWFQLTGPQQKDMLLAMEICSVIAPIGEISQKLHSLNDSYESLSKGTSFIKRLLMSKNEKEAHKNVALGFERELLRQLEKTSNMAVNFGILRRHIVNNGTMQLAQTSYMEINSIIEKMQQLLESFQAIEKTLL